MVTMMIAYSIIGTRDQSKYDEACTLTSSRGSPRKTLIHEEAFKLAEYPTPAADSGAEQFSPTRAP